MKLRTPQSESRLLPSSAEVAAQVQRPELYFDPRVDISEEDVQWLIRDIRESMVMSWDETINLANSLVVLFPDRRDEMKLEEILMEMVRIQLEESRARHNTNMIIKRTAQFIALFPERRRELHLDDDLWVAGLEAIRVNNQRDWFGLQISRDLAIIFPERAAELKLEDTWRAGIRELEKERNKPLSAFSDIAMLLIALFPDRKNEIEIDAVSWKNIKESHTRFRQVGSVMYAKEAVIAADEVRFTQEGLTLINHESLGQTPELPNRNLVA